MSMNDTQALLEEIQTLRERVELIETADVPPVVARAERTLGGFYAPGVTVLVDFNSVTVDTYNAVTTGAGAWVFTAPLGGYYRVSSTVIFTAIDSARLYLYKNGANYSTLCYSNNEYSVQGSDIVQLAKNDTVQIQVITAGANINTTHLPFIAIERIMI